MKTAKLKMVVTKNFSFSTVLSRHFIRVVETVSCGTGKNQCSVEWGKKINLERPQTYYTRGPGWSYIARLSAK